jgi:SAM-dependent methyltransferase
MRRAAAYRARRRFHSSGDYWQERYATGGNSGAGSYNHLAEFKAEIINAFCSSHPVDTVIEFGCGAGNQLLLACYAAYTGYDVSPAAIERCRQLFAEKRSWQFSLAEEYDGRQADLVLSLDVIFHLVEDEVCERYMEKLFSAARRYAIIYSSNTNETLPDSPSHVRHRNFGDWVRRKRPGWRLVSKIGNRYPYNGDWKNTSFSEFYIYENPLQIP